MYRFQIFCSLSSKSWCLGEPFFSRTCFGFCGFWEFFPQESGAQEHIHLRRQTLTYLEHDENVRTYTHNAKQNQSTDKGVSLGAFLNLFLSIFFWMLFHTPHRAEVSHESWNSPFASTWCIILHDLRWLMNHMYITPVHKRENQTLYSN